VYYTKFNEQVARQGTFAWWALMVVNSLVWGAVLSLFVFPFIRKLLK